MTYHVVITTTATPSGTSTGGTFEVQADPNLWPIAFQNMTGAWSGANCTIPGGSLHNDVKCTIAGPVDDGTLDIVYDAIPYKDFDVAGPSDQPSDFCKVYDAGDTDVGGVDCTYPGGALDLTINPWDVNPATAVNGPGQDHTITFNLPTNIS
ncbi:MAG: hypothetical protein ABI559_10660, partial [Chloroflexota bacterium]